MRRGTRLAALGLLLGAVACGGPAEVAPRPGAPLVLISIDTLRSDRLPVYGYTKIDTPALDAFAADAVTFERAYTTYPLTLPAHASLLTGLLPPEHGVRDNREYELVADQTTLAERLRQVGYRAAGVVSSMVLRESTGIAQGFEPYHDEIRGRRGTARMFAERVGDQSLVRAREWLGGIAPGEPFFLFLHLNDPHTPYSAPEPFASRYADAYDAEIAFTDSLVGELLGGLRERGVYDESLIVFTADHGEGLGDHVETEHGLLLYRETLQVPLLIKLPGGALAGTRVSEPASLIDVAPTVLRLLGIDAEDLPGHPWFSGTRPAADRPLYAETFFGRHQYGWSELRAAIAGPLHYIEAPRPELYDLVRDPAERDNLLPERQPPAALRGWLAAVDHGFDTTAEVSAEDLERLAALGYLGGASDDEPDDGGPRPDPKDHVAVAEELWAEIRRIGKTDALAAERRVLELMQRLGVRNEALSRSIAENMAAAGRPRAAVRVLEPLQDTGEPATLQLLGEVLAGAGRPERARELFARILERRPEDAEARMGLGIVALGAGRRAAAPRWVEEALARGAELAEAWNALGAALSLEGDWAGAVERWRKATELDPELADGWSNLAAGLERLGDRAGAARALERQLALVEDGEQEDLRARLRALRGAG